MSGTGWEKMMVPGGGENGLHRAPISNPIKSITSNL